MKESFEKFLQNKIIKTAEENPSKQELSYRFHGGEFKEYPHNFEKLLFAVESQKEKHKIMTELHKKLQAIDNGEEVVGFTEGKTRTVRDWDTEQERGYLTSKSGKLFPVTIGELMTDGAWGVSYKLEAGVPRDVKKRFVLVEAKRRISEILDDQIGGKERFSTRNDRIDNYNPSQTHVGKSVGGFVAEKLVETFFQKNIEDAHLPFMIEKGDFYQDGKQATDLVFHSLDNVHGDKGGELGKKDIGLQITTSVTNSNVKKKREHIERIKERGNLGFDGPFLVRLSLNDSLDLYENWKKAGRQPGGPTKMWDSGTKEMVFRKVLKDVLPEEKISEMWENLKTVQ
jgi:hypothetical protein